MRIILAIVLLTLPLAAQDVIKSTAGSSSGDAFTASEAGARGMLNSGLKIIHAVIPTNGFGNTITTNGGCTYDPSLGWTWTKKTTVYNWTTNIGPSLRGFSMLEQQTRAIGTNTVYTPDAGICSETLWDGYNIITNSGYFNYDLGCGSGSFCLWDRTSETNYPTEPAAYSFTSVTTNISVWNRHFHTNGATLSVVNTSTGTLINPPTQLPIIPETNTSDLYGYTNVLSYSQSVVTNSDSWTETTTGTRWSVSFFYYPPAYPCTVGGGNALSVPESFNYIKTVTYSDPVYFSPQNAEAQSLLSVVTPQLSGERYAVFDNTNCPIILRWNPITNTFGRLTVSIFKRQVVGGVISGAFDTSARIFNQTWDPASGAPSTPYYVDSTGIGYGTEYAYKVQLSFTTPTKSYDWTNYATAPYTAPFVKAPLPFYPYANQSTNSPDFNSIATNLYRELSWSSMAYATNRPREIAVFPITNGGYVLSTNVSNASSNAPTLLAASAMPVGTGRVSFGVTGVSGRYWSRSYGYLIGNSPSNTPPVTNCWEQKVYYTNAPGMASNLVDVTTNYINAYSFPRGRLGGWPWQSSKRLEFWPTNCQANGYLFYR